MSAPVDAEEHPATAEEAPAVEVEPPTPEPLELSNPPSNRGVVPYLALLWAAWLVLGKSKEELAQSSRDGGAEVGVSLLEEIQPTKAFFGGAADLMGIAEARLLSAASVWELEQDA